MNTAASTREESKKDKLMIITAIFVSMAILIFFITLKSKRAEDAPLTAKQEQLAKEQLAAIEKNNQALELYAETQRKANQQDISSDSIWKEEFRMNRDVLNKLNKQTTNEKIARVKNYSSPELYQYFSNLPRTIPEAVSQR